MKEGENCYSYKEALSKNAREIVMHHHTYFNRAVDLLKMLGVEYEEEDD